MRSLFVIILMITFQLVSCIDLASDNTNEKIFETSAPGQIKKSILFIKSCGATVGDSYQVSIVPYQTMLKDSDTGNVFIADSHNGAISADTSKIKIDWLTADTLKVSFDKALRVFKSNKKVEGIVVMYDSLN
jgi:hypothetical protein